MTDDQDLAGLDPYELMATEASRLDRFFAGAGAADWSKPTRCEGWSVRDLLAHLAAGEASSRTEWQARFGRFAIKELKPELTIEANDGHTRVKGEGVDVDLPDEQFVQAVAARLPADSGIDEGTAATLSATP